MQQWGVFAGSVEARTVASRKVTMSAHLDYRGIDGAEHGDKVLQCKFLLGGSGVGRFALGVESANIYDADGVRVVAFDVSTYLGNATTWFYRAIELDYVVIAYASETLLEVPSVDVGCIEVGTRAGGGAVDYYAIYSSHGLTDGGTYEVKRRCRGLCST